MRPSNTALRVVYFWEEFVKFENLVKIENWRGEFFVGSEILGGGGLMGRGLGRQLKVVSLYIYA